MATQTATLLVRFLGVVVIAVWIVACGAPKHWSCQPPDALAFADGLSCRELGLLGLQIMDDRLRFEAQARETRSRNVASRMRKLAEQAHAAQMRVEASMWRNNC